MYEQIPDPITTIGVPTPVVGGPADCPNMSGLSSLTAGCAHHLNNIVTAIATAADLAMDEVEDGTDARAYLQLIHNEAGRAADLVDSLELFSDGYGGSHEAQDFVGLLEETVGTLRRTLPEEITIEFSGPDTTVSVSADSRQLRRMIMSVATNASEAMPRGGQLTIELAVESGVPERLPAGFPPSDYARLTVSDNGIGMSPDVSDRVFHPFFTTKPTGHGTGMSMSEVYGIASSHGGHVYVESEVGVGTTVTIYLPAFATPALPEREGGNERLLLVDDDPGVLKVTRLVLEVLGYDVVTATNGLEALEVFATEDETPSLVLTDLVMPEMDGAELCEELSKRYPGTKILMVSGSAPGDPMPMLSDKGVVGFVRKPFSREELATSVREALVGPLTPAYAFSDGARD